MYQKILFSFLCFVSIYSFSQLKKDCIIFIGEKISEQSYSPPSEIDNDTMKIVSLDPDFGIKVKYRILYKLSDNYENDTIEFISLDDDGSFNFTKFKYVLFSLKESSEGNYYLPKYQYHPVAKSTDGKWAFRGNDIRYDMALMNKVTFEPMLFEDSFSYIIHSKKRLRKRFPKAYYKKENDKMIPIRGVYVDTIYKRQLIKRDCIIQYLLNAKHGV